jgi:hypothetical protein
VALPEVRRAPREPQSWHSCGRFTLEALFARSAPGILAAAQYVALLESLGDVTS